MSKQVSINYRRRILLGILGLSALSFASFKNKKGFESRFVVDLSLLDEAHLKQVEQNFSKNGLRSILATNLNQNWIRQYQSVRDHYLKKGLLLETAKEISVASQKVVFTNLWKSKEVFQQFCREVNMAELVSEFNTQPIKMKLSGRKLFA